MNMAIIESDGVDPDIMYGDHYGPVGWGLGYFSV